VERAVTVMHGPKKIVLGKRKASKAKIFVLVKLVKQDRHGWPEIVVLVALRVVW